MIDHGFDPRHPYGQYHKTESTSRGSLGEVLQLINDIEAENSKAQPNPADCHQFSTGAVRSKDADATRYDLISPIAMEALAATYAEGAEKYGDHNWLRGMPVHDLLNHALRHIFKFLSGDRSEPHLPHAAWGLMAAIHSHEAWPELNEPHLLSEGCKPPVNHDSNA